MSNFGKVGFRDILLPTAWILETPVIGWRNPESQFIEKVSGPIIFWPRMDWPILESANSFITARYVLSWRESPHSVLGDEFL